MMDLADYLGGGGGHRGGGGGHRRGGGGWGWRGGGWYGGPWYGGYVEPTILEVERVPAPPPQYVGIPAGTAPMQCRVQIAPALWRCGSTTYYDVSKYELRTSGLVAKGLSGLGEDPQTGAGAGLLFFGLLAVAGFALTR